MRRLVFRPQARSEIAEAVDWYELQSTGLGAAFLRAVDVTIASIHRNPNQYQRTRGQMRRAVLRRFPYYILYIFLEDEVVILGCAHGKRDPKRWPADVK